MHAAFAAPSPMPAASPAPAAPLIEARFVSTSLGPLSADAFLARAFALFGAVWPGAPARESRGRRASHARAAIVFALRTGHPHPLTYRTISRALGVDHQTARHALARAHRLRGSDPRFASACDQLARLARSAVAAGAFDRFEPRALRLPDPPASLARHLLEEAADACGLHPDWPALATLGPAAVRARAAAFWALRHYRAPRVSGAAIARVLNTSETRVADHLRRAEQLRAGDPDFRALTEILVEEARRPAP